MNFYVDAAYESLNKSGEELCGDKVEFVRGKDFFLAVLADGLGSGVKANILATLTSKIIATMLSNGASLTDAVETIASTLPVCKQRGLAYSTFTIVHIKNDGKVLTAEFDNPNLIYFKNCALSPIERKPVEMSDKTIYISEFTADETDMIISFSDGVVHAGVGRLLDLGWQYDNIVNYIKEKISPSMSPRMAVRSLLSAVDTLYMQKPGDDSTVCALMLKESKPACVMVGPPMNAQLDEIVVKKLMDCKGYRVVCGGTTSQIVSKITGNDLAVHLDYDNPAIPPTATIKGIDLVTEGVLTLGKSLEQVRNINSSDTEKWDDVNLNKKDGATLLTKLLLEDSTQVNFLVGRALNPAHQNPGMPVSLGLKLNLIKDLAAEISKTGKEVTIEYY